MLPPGDSFYLRLRGKTTGPYSRAQLRRMSEQGELTPFHELSDDGHRWALASDLGFGAATGGPPAAYGGPPPLPAAPAPMPAPMPYAPTSGPAAQYEMTMQVPIQKEPRWFLMDDEDQQHGPMTYSQIQTLARQGTVPLTHLVWCEGWPSWVPLGETEFAPPANYQAPAPMFQPRQAPARAPAASPVKYPTSPRAVHTPAPSRAARRGDDSSIVGMIFSWAGGIVLGLFLILIGFACLGLAVLDERASQQIDQENNAKRKKSEQDGYSTKSDEAGGPTRQSRAAMWSFAIAGVAFVAVGLSVVLVSLHKRRETGSVRRSPKPPGL